MKIIKANSTDAKEITALSLRSKDYWNYGKEQMEQWREDLTITPDYINKFSVFKLVNDDKLVGFYAYKKETAKVVKLTFLFVDPECIGKGYGKILINHFLESMKLTEFESAVVDADPNAEDFYAHIGFKVIGKLKSSIKDRYLPIMEIGLKSH